MEFLIIFGILALLTIISIAYLQLNPQFGGRISKEDRKRYARSPQWDGEKFVNLQETTADVNLLTMPELLRESYQNYQAQVPDAPLQLQPFDRQAWEQSDAGFQFIWYGHSVCLMRLEGKNLLIDPMFGPDASPVGPIRTRRFSENTLEIIDQLPELDVVLLTHDHYDHLDYQSILKLKDKADRFYVALGTKRHLLRWGIDDSRVREFDWWEEVQLGTIQLTFTPSRHFSGRGMGDRAKCLWGGWAFHTPNYRIYWSGDGGYGPHFKEIGERLGPFDWAFVECGQYYKLWTQVHQLPEEAVWAVGDVKAQTGIPVHWGAFKLAPHYWQEPAERFCRFAEEEGVAIGLPRLGELIRPEEDLPRDCWWEKP